MAKYQPKKPHDPIDPDVPIPAAIRAASARAENLHKAAYQPEEANPAPAQPSADHSAAQPENPTQPTPDTRVEPHGQERQPQEPKPETTPPTQAAQEPAKAPEGDGSWEHKYNSIKGRYDRQSETISGLNRRISELESLLATASAPRPEERGPTPAELTFKPLGQEERETFGDDFIDVAQRAALEKVSPEIARLNKIIESLQAQVGNVVTTTRQTQQQTIYQYLDAELPAWRNLNRDEKFISWANLPDPFSGVTRMAMLRDAFNKGEGPRVLRFFQGFLNDEAATDPVNRAKPETPPTGKVPLEQFAAPGRAKAPAATEIQTSPGEKETITRAQIAQFYRLKSAGHWKGNPEEEAALERRIFEAEREGRIV